MNNLNISYLSATPPRNGLMIIPAMGTAQKTVPILLAVIPSCLPINELKMIKS